MSGQERNIQEEQNVGMKQQEVSLLLLFQRCFFSVGILWLKKKKKHWKPKTTTYIGTRARYETQIHILMAAYPQPSVSQQSKNKFTHLCMCSNTEVAEISLQFSRLESLGTPKLWFLVAGGLQIT